MAAPRRFDHDEARALYATGGYTIAELARRFGVTGRGMGLVVSDRQQATLRRQVENGARADWQRKHWLRPCVRGCGRLAWHTPGRARVGVCVECFRAEHAASAPTVRPDALLCTRCGEWQPDNSFPRGGTKARRGHHALCRSCQTAARQAHRDRTKEPCVRCGKPRLSDAEQAASARAHGTTPTGLCRACFDTTRMPEPGSEAVQTTEGTES